MSECLNCWGQILVVVVALGDLATCSNRSKRSNRSKAIGGGSCNAVAIEVAMQWQWQEQWQLIKEQRAHASKSSQSKACNRKPFLELVLSPDRALQPWNTSPELETAGLGGWLPPSLLFTVRPWDFWAQPLWLSAVYVWVKSCTKSQTRFQGDGVTQCHQTRITVGVNWILLIYSLYHFCQISLYDFNRVQ